MAAALYNIKVNCTIFFYIAIFNDPDMSVSIKYTIPSNKILIAMLRLQGCELRIWCLLHLLLSSFGCVFFIKRNVAVESVLI